MRDLGLTCPLVLSPARTVQFEDEVRMWVYEEELDGRKLTEVINDTHEVRATSGGGREARSGSSGALSGPKRGSPLSHCRSSRMTL